MYNESETITKFEIMDGAPVRGESIPIRLFLSAFDLTPTYKNIHNKFSVKYYLNLVLVDEDDRRYFKQTECVALVVIPRTLSSLHLFEFEICDLVRASDAGSITLWRKQLEGAADEKKLMTVKDIPETSRERKRRHKKERKAKDDAKKVADKADKTAKATRDAQGNEENEAKDAGEDE